MKFARRIGVFLLVAACMLVVAYAALPWKSWLQHRLIAALAAQDVTPVSLTVEGVGIDGVKLKDIAIGKPAYRMDHLAVSYSILALLRGKETAPVTITSDAVSLRAAEVPVTIRHIEARLTRGATWRSWKGEWKASDIAAKDAALVLPPLAGEGTLEMDARALHITGNLANVSKTHRASAGLDYVLDGASPSQLVIAEAKMPWGGGEVALTNATLPIGAKKPIRVSISVRKVNVENLLQALGAEGTTATGVVSGSIPLTLLPDGTVRVGKGALNAAEPGIITLPPETIPGDNPQVNMVREVMKNLHYNVLALSLASDKDGNLLVKLGVEGRNPDAAGGRPIKLNVQLSGDLLNLLLQNMKLMSDPKSFIEQSGHETHP